MAEITWKTTFIGAFILFLIGLIVATCLNYARPAFTSIQAGISGPFDCYYKSTINRSILCPEDGNEDCIYIMVTFGGDKSDTRHVKLTPHYKYNHKAVTQTHQVLQTAEGPVELGRCSAEYCGDYRFKDTNAQYKRHPPLIELVKEARDKDGLIKCFLNPKEPSNGAYLMLNDEDISSAEERMFRWYEGWLLLTAPLALCIALIIYGTITFIRQRNSTSITQRPREAFVPPGFAPVTPTQDRRSSQCTSTQNRCSHSSIEELERLAV